MLFAYNLGLYFFDFVFLYCLNFVVSNDVRETFEDIMFSRRFEVDMFSTFFNVEEELGFVLCTYVNSTLPMLECH